MTARSDCVWRRAFAAARPATEGDLASIRIMREAGAWGSAAQSFPASAAGQRMAIGFSAVASAFVEASSPARQAVIAPALIACADACLAIMDQAAARAADTWRNRSDLA